MGPTKALGGCCGLFWAVGGTFGVADARCEDQLSWAVVVVVVAVVGGFVNEHAAAAAVDPARLLLHPVPGRDHRAAGTH